RQTQNPERGRKLAARHGTAGVARGSSDPKPREGTETGQRSTPALVDFRVVRPKTPRGDGNQVSNGGGNLAATGRSSDPKPREGTETWDICCPPGEMLSEVVRPKTPRGDGNFVDHHCHSLSPRVVRPKTPRGDGNLRQPFRCDADGRLGSSDPKPREGTETFARVPVSVVNRQSSDPKPREGTETRKRRASSDRLLVVRPKTPRGDGNPATIAPARADDSGRQTQNPERGRKPISGTATLREDTPSRQTQNPERGRKLDCANWLGADPGGRQTQNPERGRKLHIDFLDLARREDHVVRPKT
ncbi:hypothetical protein AO23_02390, partial [Mycobacterium tuberculosis M1488]